MYKVKHAKEGKLQNMRGILYTVRNVWRISLHVTDDAFAKLYVTKNS